MKKSVFENVTTLEEFYNQIYTQQEANHGPHYCAMHHAVVKYWNEGQCKSYMEFGIHQGGTAANILRKKPESVTLIDINLGLYNEYLKPIAIKYCKENNINLNVKECSSTAIEAIQFDCDMLLIDSYHKPDYLKQELSTHAHNINKYIIAHDTFAVPSLHKCMEDFAGKNGWKVLEYNKQNVGYTVLGR